MDIRHKITGEVLLTIEGDTLRGADLSYKFLHAADLYRQDLRGANLEGATLYYADLRLADLRGANLRNTALHGARLDWAARSPRCL